MAPTAGSGDTVQMADPDEHDNATGSGLAFGYAAAILDAVDAAWRPVASPSDWPS
jgi:hypothetical protein